MKERYLSLDGWRGVSIAQVIAGHWFPVGLPSWDLNGPVADSGMALFFILSGFLITTILLKDQSIKSFLIRRLARIVPLFWLVVILFFTLKDATTYQWIANLLFFANIPPIDLVEGAQHFWSLSIEVQFYAFVAVLVALAGRRGLMMLPIVCLGVTAFRVMHGAYEEIETYFRADELLAGCVLALIYQSQFDGIKMAIGRLSTPALFVLLIFSAHPASHQLAYARPYIAMLVVGSTLFASETYVVNRLLAIKPLVYFAQISYAVYVFHGVLGSTWLGSGDTLERYLKRPLLCLVTWFLAHVSTFYYEKRWIDAGKRWSQAIGDKERGALKETL